MQESEFQSLGQEDSPEEGMATHSSILAWEIPWTEEPGGLHTVHGVAKTQLSDYTYTTTLWIPHSIHLLLLSIHPFRARSKVTKMVITCLHPPSTSQSSSD